VNLHHGEISVTSIEGVGTEFIVTLLLGRDHFKSEEIVSAVTLDVEADGKDFQEKLLHTSDQLKVHGTEGIAHGVERKRASTQKLIEKPTILLVEDNPDMRSYILSHQQSQYQMIEAKDGQEGMELALQQIPDLIISDVMMPRMDGFELCQKLKTNELTSHIPIILLTAKGSDECKIKGLELGAVDYITKPFDKQELKLRINNLLQFQRRLQEQLRKQIIAAGTKIFDAQISSRDDKFINKIMQVAEQQITNPDFSPEKLAREVGMSRAHLNRKLKGLLNQRTNDFIRTMRLKRAALLLEKKAGNVSEIAYEVGFNHLAYFARSFKKQYGVAPSEYQVR
jgi:DNA-binding response OmpR family regulator